jgi:hypothetical protein
MFTCHYTRDQAVTILASVGVRDALPGKGKMLIVNFPNRTCWKVTKATQKSTYGRPLWTIEQHTAESILA